MNLYKIYQAINNDWGTYDSAVVCALSIEEARTIHPSNRTMGELDKGYRGSDWCDIKDVNVAKIGVAVEGITKGVMVASLNAG